MPSSIGERSEDARWDQNSLTDAEVGQTAPSGAKAGLVKLTAAQRSASSGSAKHASRLEAWSAVGTCCLSVVLAVASIVPPIVVALSATVWVILVGVVVARRVLSWRSWTPSEWFLGAAVILAATRLCSLGVLQLRKGNQGLSWNVDWRYAATQAEGIARFGGLADSLDYSGEPVGYHVGPAWLAGSVSHVAGIPVGPLLFTVVPGACLMAISLAARQVLRNLGLARNVSALSVAMVLCLPSNPYWLIRESWTAIRGPSSLLDVWASADAWVFSPGLMLNSLLAMAVGFSACQLLLGSPTLVQSGVAAAGLGSLLAVKPQYAVGFVAALGLGIVWNQSRRGGRVRRLSAALLGLAGASGVALLFQHSTIQISGLAIAVDRDFVGALFGLNSLFVAIAILGGCFLLSPRARHRRSPVARVLVGALGGGAALFVALDATIVQVDPEGIARANGVGLPYGIESQDVNFSQAMVAVGAVAALFVAGLVFAELHGRGPIGRATSMACTALAVVAVLPLTIRPILDPGPSGGYESVSDPALARLMMSSDGEEGLWLANDLADPAEDYARPLRASGLTSFSGAQFYVSNVAYMNWARSDVEQRVDETRRFFETPWSACHAEFLALHDVRHILIHDRCPVAWIPTLDAPSVRREGAWTLVVAGQGHVIRVKSEATVGQSPRYGQSACLRGAGPKP